MSTDASPAPSAGKRFWRSLEELAGSPDFQEMMRREFPDQAAEWNNAISRRRFLTLLGASTAFAGLSGCNVQLPEEKILPYNRKPEDLVSGKPLYFATAMTLVGRAVGLLVESNEGRPTKIEGNPQHPASLGATDVFAQASVLTLYDPDRSQAVKYKGRPAAYSDFVRTMRDDLTQRKKTGGAGLHILTETLGAPSLAGQLLNLLSTYPKATWRQYEPAALDNALEGSISAFGEPVNTRYDFTKADVILSLDADFLGHGPGHLAHVRAFASRRRVQPGHLEMNRLYVVEATPTITGMKADERLPARASDVEFFTRALATRLGRGTFAIVDGLWVEAKDFLNRLVGDLKEPGKSSVVVAGDGQPPAVHVLAHWLNHMLGNVGKTVFYTAPIEAKPVNQVASLTELAGDIDAGAVETLLILGGNPVYSAPADLRFGDLLKEKRAEGKLPLCVHLSVYDDETSQLCQWHVPEAHFLESWSDGRAFDGTASIGQPLIAPLYSGKSAQELLSALAEEMPRSGYEIVRDFWRSAWVGASSSGDFEQFWRRALHDGLIAGTAFAPKQMRLQEDWMKRAGLDQVASPPARKPGALELIFRPDPTVFDGRFANNGWLQELPKPVTQLTWDNAVLLSPRTAEALGLDYVLHGKVGDHGGNHGEARTELVEFRRNGEIVQVGGRPLQAPVWIVPGHADDSLTVHFGYGRTRAGQVGSGIGFNASALRVSSAPFFDNGLELRKTGERFTLACTQAHHPMDATQETQNRGIIRTGTLAEYREDEKSIVGEEHGRRSLTLYNEDEHLHGEHQWAMLIDLTACIGCNACVVACQAENSIPVVGKEQVTRGREMHWIRVDRYFQGSEANPRAFFQPVPCMHCENAPCELVCPVAATTHSPDGLNEMTYNRCVGTRYCSNNCPYKVRRFNFLQFADYATSSLKLMRNPAVTVRSRGVMEKCTYCVQRIRAAEIDAKNQHRSIRDGDVVTACQAACPANAIIFGDQKNTASKYAQRKSEAEDGHLHYGLLEGLNTRPRTTYVAELRNPKSVLT
jgi:molybdopterin-containing oxidoreductase family iron-sulfur binding subunit